MLGRTAYINELASGIERLAKVCSAQQDQIADLRADVNLLMHMNAALIEENPPTGERREKLRKALAEYQESNASRNAA
jgi:hypothetical protein